MPTATPSTDALVAQLMNEIEDRNAFVNGLVEAAQKEGRDLQPQEMELITRARDRIAIVNGQLAPLQETTKIAMESRAAGATYAAEIAALTSPAMAQKVEYRSASGYALDRWKAAIGNDEAMQRLELYERAAAHQTTSDNPGIIPEPLLQPVLDYVDYARPICGVFGPQPLTGSGFVSHVTQHTSVAKQTAEKTELASRKMIITKTPIDADTFGGYVNVSRQNIDWSNPNALDTVINDLAGQYSIETEEEAGTVLYAGATAGPTLPAAPTTAEVAAAVWAAAGQAYGATYGLGRLFVAFSPDMLGLIGPLFPNVNPQNASSPGFSAADFGSGAVGSVSGISFVMTAGLDAGQIVAINTASANLYEDRVGALQVVEPSVLGVQVAYAGYFKVHILNAGGIVKVTVGP
jgi:HK97 family phage major capsid protein